MGRSSHTPQRRCASCGNTAAKGEMLRIMRVLHGDEPASVEIDVTGRGAGRGVYVCSAECLEKAVKSRLFERALKMKIDADAYDRIREQGLQLL